MTQTDTLEPTLKKALRPVQLDAARKIHIKGKIMDKKTKQTPPEGKVKVNFFLRNVTNTRIETFAEKMNLRVGAFVDLIFSDETLITELVQTHAQRMVESLAAK